MATINTQLKSFRTDVMRGWDIARTRYDVWREKRKDKADARAVIKREKDRERERQRIESRLKGKLRRELNMKARRISDRLTQLEFARFYRQEGERRQQIKRVRFAEAAATPAALYLRIDTVRMPRGRGINSEAIMAPEVISDLALAAGCHVEAFRHYEKGLWLVVDREHGLASIPSFVEYIDALSSMPQSAGVLDIPLGYGSNNRFYHADISEMPHLMVAGATGYGKSVFLHSLILSVIQRATPQQVRIVLADLKGGAELGLYRDVPHIYADPEDSKRNFRLTGEIYTGRDQVAPLLDRVLEEVNDRLQKFQNARVRDLAAWNFRNRKQRLARWVVIIDEIQNVMLGPGRSHVEETLVDIASRSRAAGIHMVIATQRPDVKVITGLIKANFPARVAFRTASQADSRVILDTSEAAALDARGRMVFLSDARKMLCQSPMISQELVEDVVSRVCEGGPAITDTSAHSVGALEMIRWAIEENDGSFSIDATYRAFKSRGVTHRDVRELAANNVAEVVQIDDKFYRLQRARGNSGRRWVEVDA